MELMTFKQYLDSREQLLEAVKNTPVTVLEYNITKYCGFPVGDSIEEKQLISLKPKHKIIVEWQHTNPISPYPLSIRFDGPGMDITEEYPFFWDGSKLHKWLLRHASNGKHTNYKK